LRIAPRSKDDQGRLEITGLTKVLDTPSGPFVAVKDVNAEI